MQTLGCAQNSAMQRIHSATTAPLFDTAATRRIEHNAAAALPAHALMQRAGLAVARLAMAIAPHARTIWIACGPGNNGGDGLEAAACLQARGFTSIVTWLGHPDKAPADARWAWERAQAAGVTFADTPPERWDLAIDALLGIGASRPLEGAMADWLGRMRAAAAPLLCVDVPSGLDADTGNSDAIESIAGCARSVGVSAVFCLNLLSLKPGVFTARGRDAAGEVWFDDLGCHIGDSGDIAPTACLVGAPEEKQRREGTNKGSFGDVGVIGGAPGMVGGALLAATAALHAGAGRVLVGLLGRHAIEVDPAQPDLMLRDPASLDPSKTTIVCGCGGGDAVRDVLPKLLSTAQRLVLDADALNAIAGDAVLQTLLEARGKRPASRSASNNAPRETVLTPHPLEAARLLGCDAQAVQQDRLGAAQRLADRFGAVVVLKGSGSIVAAPGALPSINLSGNARLAIAGTGDVLAGMIGAALAGGESALDAARAMVWRHGDRADRWPSGRPLTAFALARGVPGEFE